MCCLLLFLVVMSAGRVWLECDASIYLSVGIFIPRLLFYKVNEGMNLDGPIQSKRMLRAQCRVEGHSLVWIHAFFESLKYRTTTGMHLYLQAPLARQRRLRKGPPEAVSPPIPAPRSIKVERVLIRLLLPLLPLLNPLPHALQLLHNRRIARRILLCLMQVRQPILLVLLTDSCLRAPEVRLGFILIRNALDF